METLEMINLFDEFVLSIVECLADKQDYYWNAK